MANIDSQILSDRARAEAAANASKAVEGLTKLPDSFLNKLGINPDYTSYVTGSPPSLPTDLEEIGISSYDGYDSNVKGYKLTLSDDPSNYDWIKEYSVIHVYDPNTNSYTKNTVISFDSSIDAVYLDNDPASNSSKILERETGAYYDGSVGELKKIEVHADRSSWIEIGKIGGRNAITISPDQEYPYYSNTNHYGILTKIRVPSDYATIQEAFDAVKDIATASRTKIVIEIESGYVIPTGSKSYSDQTGEIAPENTVLWVENGDYSHIVLSTEDSTVEVEDGFSGSLIRNVNANGVSLNAFYVDMRGLGGSYGYSAEGSANCFVGEFVDIVNAPDKGFAAVGGTIFCDVANANGAGGAGFYATNGGAIKLYNCNASSCNYGFHARRGGSIYLMTGDGLNATSKAMYAEEGSQIIALRAKLRGSQGNAVHARDSSVVKLIDAYDTDVNELSTQANPTLGTALLADDKSQIIATAFIHYCEGLPVVSANTGSEIVLKGGEISNPVNNPIESNNASVVRVANTDITFYDGNAYTVSDGGFIYTNSVGTANIELNRPKVEGIIYYLSGNIPDYIETSQKGSADGVAPLNSNSIIDSQYLLDYILSSEKGSADGVAPLDSSGIVSDTYLENYGTVYYKTADPTASADTDSGYEKGDVWINTNTDGAFIATNVSSGAAVWVSLAGGASSPSLSIATPTANDIYITLKASTDFEIAEVVHYMNAGSLDFDVKVNGTSQYSVTGVGQTITTSTPSSPIAVTEGDNVSIQCSNISADAALLSITLLLG